MEGKKDGGSERGRKEERKASREEGHFYKR